MPVGFQGMASGVRWWEKKSLAGRPARPMHHRRTVDLDIPRQVAPLQSLTPLLQANEA
jgi:hypothetical protein